MNMNNHRSPPPIVVYHAGGALFEADPCHYRPGWYLIDRHAARATAVRVVGRLPAALPSVGIPTARSSTLPPFEGDRI